jgi:hypothetical protein
MGVPFDHALEKLPSAAEQVFKHDPRVRAIGITRHHGAFGYRVVRNVAMPVAQYAAFSPADLDGIPVAYADAREEPRAYARIPIPPAIVALAAGAPPEQALHRPLTCGLEVQNFDDDVRSATIAGGQITIGTLGCFVQQAGQAAVCLLSNNHVIAGENRGARGADRILQPGAGVFTPGRHVATLTDYVALLWSPPGASPAAGGVNWNDVDAGVAELVAGIGWVNEFLPVRALPPLAGIGAAAVGDDVFKVGRTTGLTRGTVTSIATIVGPVGYGPRQAWFQNSIEIVGLSGGPFSAGGDSGAAIVDAKTNNVVALLYAGNGSQTFACPIDLVLTALGCALA